MVPTQGEWGWTVPSADLLPDVTAVVDLAHMHRGGQTASPGVVDAPAAAGANGGRAAASDVSQPHGRVAPLGPVTPATADDARPDDVRGGAVGSPAR